MVTIEESEITKRLAAWAGIFAAATAFAGIWGMNFEHMPELKWQCGYPLALGVIALTCILLYRQFALPWEGRLLRVGASAGVAALQADMTEVAHWLGVADRACYDAKGAGRGQARTADLAVSTPHPAL